MYTQTARQHLAISGSAERELPSDSDRRKYLAQLFGDEASAKISVNTADMKTTGSDIEWIGVEGAELQWGQSVVAEEETCSVETDVGCMPLQPTMIKLQPLVPGSKLYCYRLEMPLGMLIEVDTPITYKAMVAPIVRSFVGESCEDDAETCDTSQAYVGGIIAGDIVRATSYVTMGMKHEAWQMALQLGGTPVLKKALMPTANQPFDRVMQAIVSNSASEKGNDQIVLLVERRFDV
jgi:hypothetical protein